MTITPDEAKAMVAPARIWISHHADQYENPVCSDPLLFGDPKEHDLYLSVDAITAQPEVIALREADRAEIERLTRQNEAWQRNSRETFEAMCAFRDTINEHLPVPSLESDLMQGPENSVFFARVAEAIVARVAELEADRVNVAETALRMAGDVAVATTEEPLGSHAGDSRAFTIAKRILAIAPAAVLEQLAKEQQHGSTDVEVRQMDGILTPTGGGRIGRP